ncbi:cytochrome P450 2G1-like [Ambystoma mexicanum]|uniref:cytochrome P450 2G1-like n=1 Tax=Ambystoma mexicanum TaxID=8296 RepID=UPI0037E84EFF
MGLAGEASVYLLACFLCLLLLSVWRRYGEKSHLPPGPTPLPVIGNLHQLKASEMVKSIKALSEKYGPVFTLHLGLRRVVVLWGYDAVKEALVDRGDEFGDRGPLPTFGSVLDEYGVTMSNGSRWKELRRFTLKTMKDLGMGKRSIEEKIREEARYLIEELKMTKELPFDPTIHICNAVSNVTCSVLFGNRFDYQDEEFREVLRMMNEAFVLSSSIYGQMYNMFTDIMDHLPGPHKRIYALLSRIQRFTERRVKMNQETLDLKAPRDFIDHFLIKMDKEKENPSTEFFKKNLVVSVLGLFIVGTQTVSTTLRHALLLLGKHAEIAEKVLGEIDRVIGRDRIPSIEDRIKMPYADAVIHEILRFSDILPFGIPHMMTQNTNFRGFKLPKGMEVYPILSSVLHDPNHFSDPENFSPGNFLDENGRFKKNNAFMPFSAGKRGCVGEGMARMEIFIYVTSILQRFKLTFPGNPKDIDTRPRLSGFENIPANYKLQVIPHES